ncbi:hypothetical protein [Bacillus massiliigorillae]|uniref:hypothetical protein n=1 Tax=Bacillus massiliigorillae TaxID=1243664 RepID=UPI0003A9C65A|nr:hypothetical protein [Bacillus massiliigorillae]
MTFSFMISTLLIICLLVIVINIVKDANKKQERPSLFSLIIFGLLLLNWILYMTSFYTYIPATISEILFLPIWFTLALSGLIVAILNKRKNSSFSIAIGGISVFSGFFGLFLYWLSNM